MSSFPLTFTPWFFGRWYGEKHQVWIGGLSEGTTWILGGPERGDGVVNKRPSLTMVTMVIEGTTLWTATYLQFRYV